ncbi:MAG: T9SS type A sorting domain-containing protein, partial [Bacteroidota bacterium]
NDGGGGGSGPPNDFLEVTLSNGIENVILETISESQSNWRAESVFFVADFLEVTENMQISFRTLDQPDTGHLVEAGVDAFIVVEGESTSTLVIDPLALQLEAFPNPFKEEVTLSYQLDEEIDQATLILINALGQTVIQRKLNNQNGVLELGQELIPGMYFVQILGESKRSPILKVVKH